MNVIDKNIQAVLREALKLRGLSEEEAHHISLSADFLGKITEETAKLDTRDISVISAAYASLLSRHKNDEPVPVPIDESDAEATYTSLEKIFREEKQSSVPKISEKLRALKPGPRRFSVISLCSLLYLSAFLVYTLSIALGVVFIASMIAVTVAGIVLFIAGLLYGVSQIGIFTSAGLYEIGLGLILGGVAVLLVILIYNLLMVLTPFLRKKLLSLILRTAKAATGALKPPSEKNA